MLGFRRGRGRGPLLRGRPPAALQPRRRPAASPIASQPLVPLLPRGRRGPWKDTDTRSDRKLTRSSRGDRKLLTSALALPPPRGRPPRHPGLHPRRRRAPPLNATDSKGRRGLGRDRGTGALGLSRQPTRSLISQSSLIDHHRWITASSQHAPCVMKDTEAIEMLAVCLVLIQTLVESHGIVAARTVPKGSPRPPSTPPLPPRRFFPRPVPHIHTRHPIPCHNCFGSPAAPFPATDAPLPSPLAPVYPAFGRTHPWQGQGARRRSAIALHLTPRGARPSPQPPAGSAFGAQIERRRRSGGRAGERDSDLLRAGAVVRAGLS